jgi:hypothetical protein
MNLATDTVELIDELRQTFAEFTSRGQVVDLAFAYLAGDAERLVAAFGEDEADSSDNNEDREDGENVQ